MASKTSAKVESGEKNETAQGMEQVTNGASVMSLADHSTQGQQSGVQNTGSSSVDLESSDASFEKALECSFRNQSRQLSLLQQLRDLLTDLKAEQPNRQQWLNEQRFNQLVSQLQRFGQPPEVWNWSAWQQMSPQEQIEQTEQLKQLVEKYVVAVKYLIIEENMSTNMPQSLPSYKLSKVHYTSEAHINYVSKYCGEKIVLFLGINPSERGMKLGGVPFCDDKCFSNWLRITKNVEQSTQPNLNANVDEFDKAEGDSVGKRFWGLVKEICGTPEVFFQNCFVRNYCPLLFRDDSGKYVTLERVNADTQKEFKPHCDQALRECIQALGVGTVVAVGGYVSNWATQALTGMAVEVVQILHPSGLNRLNGGFTDDNVYIEKARSVLQEHGIIPYMKP